MLICNTCGRCFPEPDIVTERHGLESPPFEKWVVCPGCGSSFIEEERVVPPQVSRREVLENLIEVVARLNDFSEEMSRAIGGDGLKNSCFEKAKMGMVELIFQVAGEEAVAVCDRFEMEELLQNPMTDGQFDQLCELACRRIGREEK